MSDGGASFGAVGAQSVETVAADGGVSRGESVAAGYLLAGTEWAAGPFVQIAVERHPTGCASGDRKPREEQPVPHRMRKPLNRSGSVGFGSSSTTKAPIHPAGRVIFQLAARGLPPRHDVE